MSTILIETNDESVAKWQRLSPKTKERLEKIFEQQIDILSNDDDIRRADFKSLLDRVGDKAVANGLTEEILQQLLQDE